MTHDSEIKKPNVLEPCPFMSCKHKNSREYCTLTACILSPEIIEVSSPLCNFYTRYFVYDLDDTKGGLKNDRV